MKQYILIPLLIVGALPTMAFAQGQRPPSSAQTVFRAGLAYQTSLRTPFIDRETRREEPATECLVNQTTGLTVCLRRSEWEEVAAGKRDGNGRLLRR